MRKYVWSSVMIVIGSMAVYYFPFHLYSKSDIKGVTLVAGDMVSDKEEEIVPAYKEPIIDISFLNMWRRNGGFVRDLKIGDSGQDVKILEEFLRVQGYGITSTDSYYGTSTEQALRNYQMRNIIFPTTGDFSGITRNRIQQDLLDSACPLVGGNKTSLDTTFLPIGKEISVEKEYIPADLKMVSQDALTDGLICLREDAADAYTLMYKALEKEGLVVMLNSGYRRYEHQDDLYDHRVQLAKTYPSVAIPGHSEHQLGVAIDVSAKSQNYKATSKDFKYSKEYTWMLENAHLYGYVLSYPEGKEEITGYTYEPWHWRYVGTEVAYSIYISTLTPIEFLRSIVAVEDYFTTSTSKSKS